MKNIIVTGASKGIGRAVTILLAQKGHKVFAIARTERALKNLILENYKGDIVTLTADLTDENDIDHIVKTIGSETSIDALINNAGLLINKPFLKTSIDDWQEQLEVNLIAPVRLIKRIHPNLRRGSHILNIGSMGGFQGSAKFEGLSAYSASKGALSILTESLSVEFANSGIAVNCLCLGAVQTKMLREAFPGYQAPTSPEQMAAFISDFALNGHNYFNGRILPVSLNNPN
ncbi:MAG: SDR family oxidoreductase [Balneola sp.]|nr:MAG: SDR family oxidoreductase [Balneola sp.]